jgi:hypothetical protein
MVLGLSRRISGVAVLGVYTHTGVKKPKNL